MWSCDRPYWTGCRLTCHPRYFLWIQLRSSAGTSPQAQCCPTWSSRPARRLARGPPERRPSGPSENTATAGQHLCEPGVSRGWTVRRSPTPHTCLHRVRDHDDVPLCRLDSLPRHVHALVGHARCDGHLRRLFCPCRILRLGPSGRKLVAVRFGRDVRRGGVGARRMASFDRPRKWPRFLRH